ncbi:MAG: hypothetical protein SGJ27_29175 [Candidatus Melainabacteria bacterium]|nr:hypothetical protein [Candidatus Melainabacteria bacterium]
MLRIIPSGSQSHSLEKELSSLYVNVQPSIAVLVQLIGYTNQAFSEWLHSSVDTKQIADDYELKLKEARKYTAYQVTQGTEKLWSQTVYKLVCEHRAELRRLACVVEADFSLASDWQAFRNNFICLIDQLRTAMMALYVVSVRSGSTDHDLWILRENWPHKELPFLIKKTPIDDHFDNQYEFARYWILAIPELPNQKDPLMDIVLQGISKTAGGYLLTPVLNYITPFEVRDQYREAAKIFRNAGWDVDFVHLGPGLPHIDFCLPQKDQLAAKLGVDPERYLPVQK